MVLSAYRLCNSDGLISDRLCNSDGLIRLPAVWLCNSDGLIHFDPLIFAGNDVVRITGRELLIWRITDVWDQQSAPACSEMGLPTCRTPICVSAFLAELHRESVSLL